MSHDARDFHTNLDHRLKPQITKLPFPAMNPSDYYKASDRYVDPAQFINIKDYVAAACHAAVRRQMVLVVPTDLTRVTKQFILIQRPGRDQTDILPSLLNFSGGKLNHNEQPPAAAEREFLEETGLTLSNPKLAGVIAPSQEECSSGNFDWIVFVYTGQCHFAIRAAQRARTLGGELKTYYSRADQMMTRYCVPNIPIIASLCAHDVRHFVIEDARCTPVYQGKLTLYRNMKESYEPAEIPRELPWATVPPIN